MVPSTQHLETSSANIYRLYFLFFRKDSKEIWWPKRQSDNRGHGERVQQVRPELSRKQRPHQDERLRLRHAPQRDGLQGRPHQNRRRTARGTSNFCKMPFVVSFNPPSFQHRAVSMAAFLIFQSFVIHTYTVKPR